MTTEAIGGGSAPISVSGIPSVRATLLHRPPPPTDGLARPRLNAALDHSFNVSSVVVCAPAGSGKTVAVSQWCDHVDRPVAWLSLDPSIDDLRWFLMHLVAAVRGQFPDTLDVASQMVTADQFPTESAVTVNLSNELVEVPEPMVVVLDDYHLVTHPAIHRVVADLLRHPSPSIHLVIISREEPPLPMASLRAQNRVADLNMAQLAFSRHELELFLERAAERPSSPELVRELFDSTEGWPTGARLAVEALRSGRTASPAVAFADSAAQEFLLSEALDRVPPHLRRHLFVASHFDRFNASICDAASTAGVGASSPTSVTGAEFIDWALGRDLFLVPLDESGEWFRFHHLFKRLLDDWRRAGGTVPEFDLDLDLAESEIRRAAAEVFREHGMIEDSIEQLQLVGALDDIVAVAVDAGTTMIEQGQWIELARLVSVIPSQVVFEDPDLLMLHACVVGENQSRYAELNEILDRVESLLDRRREPRPTDRWLRGHVAVLRGVYSRLVTSDFEGAVADAEVARELLADKPGRRLVLAYVLGVVASAGAGRSEEGHRLAASVSGDPRFAGSPFDPMALSLSYLGWLEGDLGAVERYAVQFVSTGDRPTPADFDTMAHYFLGIAAYERNQLNEAEVHLSIVFDRGFASKALYVVHAGMALACTEVAQGRPEEGEATARSVEKLVLDTRSEFLQPEAEAFMAEFNLRQGRVGPARHWARIAESPPHRYRFMWYNPAPSLIEVLVSSESDEQRCRSLIEHELESARRSHHRPLTIRLLGLQALERASRGDEHGATEALGEAVIMSHDGGIIRQLADLGPALSPLLLTLDLNDELLAHTSLVLEAIEPASENPRPSADRHADGTRSDAPTLTEREDHVLRLLGARYSNKEIARDLLIAPATVKKCTVTLYEKLNVHGRREAVAKARALGLLDD